ncbi:o-succinylbenzoate synthase [Vibrio sp. SCSIO 43136]|uniref:o-succinylbenzoate synthase n=1 Tax=Vibrio sp. SCSIO 43136 TaxID=2819101 RepID=UPI00207570F7|nr:o-succinylbenzoate synthase [Vibrio sp. SCSIO 43136]USD64456.1 o-succinylbenzoate synthase [Vibrio sp. SCSIO 43136]
MREAKLYRYCLPMDSGVILRQERITERHGYVVELREGSNLGYGEIAPLPGFSLETLEEAEQSALALLEKWQQGSDFDFEDVPPSVAFALSVAELELNKTLPHQGNYQAAPLCVGDPDALIPVLNNMQGEKVAKIKVGLYEPIRDGMIVNLFLESIPDLSLRLDANRAWSKEEALKFADYINPSYRQRIAYIEEPCRQPEHSFAFAIDTGIAVAWDETLQHAIRDPYFKLAELTGAKTLVIKPTVIGSVQRIQELIAQAEKMAMKVVISSSIESSLGLCQLARLSQWLTPDSVPGLDTISLFQEQLEVAWPGCELPLSTLDKHTLIKSF